MTDKLYFAPLEGIGGYIYRNAQAKYFTHPDKYFAPFISPTHSNYMINKEQRDLDPENNRGIYLVPQIIANDAECFIGAAKRCQEMGYKEVNLNMGCPSKTVVTKRKGSGMLMDLEKLDAFLDQIYSSLDMEISLKTRVGMKDYSEALPVMEIINKYPVSELIIHPRLQIDYYKNQANKEVFNECLNIAKMPVVYNGDLFNKNQYASYIDTAPDINAVMLGRGVISDPGIFGQIKDNNPTDIKTLKEFHDYLVEEDQRLLSGDHVVIAKMKEVWFYMHHIFTNGEKYQKKIRKAKNLNEYKFIAKEIFKNETLIPSTFSGTH